LGFGVIAEPGIGAGVFTGDGEYDAAGVPFADTGEAWSAPLVLRYKFVMSRRGNEGVWSEQQTEQIILAAARVGQHVFAVNVLSNCGQRCVFCGLKPYLYRRSPSSRPSTPSGIPAGLFRCLPLATTPRVLDPVTDSQADNPVEDEQCDHR
jgi:hypothetical protein